MSRRSQRAGAASADNKSARTEAAMVGKGRAVALDIASAEAIATASLKAGFPVPPTAAVVIEAQRPDDAASDPFDTQTPAETGEGGTPTETQEG